MTENANPAPTTTAPAEGWVVVAAKTGRAVTVHGVTVHTTPDLAEHAAKRFTDDMADWYAVELELVVKALADYVPPVAPAPEFAPAPPDLAALATLYPAPRIRTTYEYALARGAHLHRDGDALNRGRAYSGFASAEDAHEEAAEVTETLADYDVDGYHLHIVRRATTTTVGPWELH